MSISERYDNMLLVSFVCIVYYQFKLTPRRIFTEDINEIFGLNWKSAWTNDLSISLYPRIHLTLGARPLCCRISAWEITPTCGCRMCTPIRCGFEAVWIWYHVMWIWPLVWTVDAMQMCSLLVIVTTVPCRIHTTRNITSTSHQRHDVMLMWWGCDGDVMLVRNGCDEELWMCDV